jgi:release factor glutamine methyltransferase
MAVVTFMGLSFEANAEVLSPREETELLARTALDLIGRVAAARQTTALTVIDMCCGSGNLACTLAHEKSDLRVWAADLTAPCVTVARANATRLGVESRVEVRQGDLFAAFDGAGLEGAVDVVVCNPPYISTGRLANESAHLLEGQPREAFDGGPYGFAVHRRMIGDSPRYLRPGGWLVMEIGIGQERQIHALFSRAIGYESVIDFRDVNGAARVMAARRRDA